MSALVDDLPPPPTRGWAAEGILLELLTVRVATVRPGEQRALGRGPAAGRNPLPLSPQSYQSSRIPWAYRTPSGG